MPVNDNWDAVHECDYCGHTQFCLINDFKLNETRILCAKCGVEHLMVTYPLTTATLYHSHQPYP